MVLFSKWLGVNKKYSKKKKEAFFGKKRNLFKILINNKLTILRD